MGRKIMMMFVLALSLPLVFASCFGSGGGGGGGGGGDGGAHVWLSGKIFYEKVPCTMDGLDLLHLLQVPLMYVQVQAVKRSGGSVLDETLTDQHGNYSLYVPTNTKVYIRALAVSMYPDLDNPSFQIEVDEDASGTLWAAASADINVGTSNINHPDLLIPDDTRASGPYNILNVITNADLQLLDYDPHIVFDLITVEWNVNLGEDIGTGFDPQTFTATIMGQRNVDSDEFDDHVIAHEYGHFIAWTMFRDDSEGGPHSNVDKLDPRVSWSEGFADWYSGAVLDDPMYIDTIGPQGGDTMGFDMDLNNDPNWPYNGVWSEHSVFAILWDISANSNDGLNLGPHPIYDTSGTNSLNDNADLMYFNPWAAEFLSQNSSVHLGVQNLMAGQGIAYPEPAGLVFHSITLPVNMTGQSLTCDTTAECYNKWDANKFYRFTLAVQATVTVTTTCPNDIDLYLLGEGTNGQKGWILDYSNAIATGNESVTTILPAGTYVIDVQGWDQGTQTFTLNAH